MRSQCIPFAQIPHSSKLFRDFLSGVPELTAFYRRSALFSDWFREEASKISYSSDRRERVSAALEKQNRRWGASAKTLQNIERLGSGACAVVTGQQVGLFGGPLFSLLKALTATKLAAVATAEGVDSVPVFWLATEDHDLAEINHVGLLSANARLQTASTPTQGTPDAPVGTIAFGDEVTALVNQATELLGDSEITEILRQCYRPGETFGSSFARLFARLFAEWGVILLDPSDPALHAIARPIFSAAIEGAAEMDDALLARGRALESAGYPPQVKVTSSSTLLFTIRNGVRTVLHRRNGEFIAGEEKIPATDLCRRIADHPEQFSPNVLLRPVMQDYLLPTLAYTGGAAEIAYWAQAGVVYEKLLGRITPIVHRFSATVVDAKAQGLLKKHQLTFFDMLDGPESLREKLASRGLPAELLFRFGHASSHLQQALAEISSSLAKLDATLVDAASRAESKMQYQLRKLQGRAARAEIRKHEVFSRHADRLSTVLYPGKSLQERGIGGVSFLAAHGRELLSILLDAYRPECVDHQVITL